MATFNKCYSYNLGNFNNFLIFFKTTWFLYVGKDGKI